MQAQINVVNKGTITGAGASVVRWFACKITCARGGLIKNKNFIDKKDKGEAVEEQYYQVRAYAGNVVIYSTIVKQKL